MKQVSAEIRKEIIKYYQNHNIAQTAEQFVLSTHEPRYHAFSWTITSFFIMIW